jgi:protease-4
VLLTKNQKPVDRVDVRRGRVGRATYIAMPAHAIVAEPSTLTGSIGVVMTKFVIDGTLKKIGLNMEGVSQGKYGDLYSPVRPFSPERGSGCGEHAGAPTTRSSRRRHRGATPRRRRSTPWAGARVDGRQAKQIGLVDELGGLDRAVSVAKQRAKIAQDAEVELVIYPPKKSFYDLFKRPFGSSDRAATLASLLGFSNPRVLQTLAAPLQVFRSGEPLALMPNVVCALNWGACTKQAGAQRIADTKARS